MYFLLIQPYAKHAGN